MKAVRRGPDEVDCVQLRYPMTIEGPNGTVAGKKGDWLVSEGDRQYFMGPGEFSAAFAPKVDPPQVPPTYVPVPCPYPVYPQPQPYYTQPTRWLTTPSIIYGSTSGNISIGQHLDGSQIINTTPITSGIGQTALGVTALNQLGTNIAVRDGTGGVSMGGALAGYSVGD